MTQKDLKQDYSERTLIDLPIKESSLKSHLRNVDYAIEQIKKQDGMRYVIGYRLVRGWGNREIEHEVLPKEIAERLKEDDETYRYDTINDLLQRRDEILAGKFKLHEGLITGLNPSYSP